MNNKSVLILTVLILIISVSIVAAQNGTDIVSHSDDSDNITIADSADDEKLSQSDNGQLKESDGTVTIKKVWDDNNNADGKRPSSVKVNVSIRGDYMGEYTLSADNQWQITLEVGELESDSDLEIVEENVAGYTSKVSGGANDGYTITNTLDNPQNNTAPSDNSDDKSSDDSTDDDSSSEKTTTTTTTTVKKTSPDKKAENKTKDKHNTGNPILLGVLAFSAAGLAYNLRRKD